MNEILDRIAAALEKQNDISAQNVALFAKSVELQEEGCMRNREMHALDYEHSLLSVERHYFLRMRELLGLFVLSGEDRADLLPVLFTAFNKWKQAMEDIDPTANIDFGLVERIFKNDLRITQQALLRRIEEGTAESLSKDIISALEIVTQFLNKKREEETPKEDEDMGPDDPEKAPF